MKRVKFLASAIIAFSLLALSCTDETTDDSAGTKTTTEQKENAIDVSSLKVGSSVVYGGTEYLVTKNAFYSSSSRSALADVDVETISSCSESDDEIEENLEYIRKYLDKDFRKSLLSEKLGITEYAEIFKKTTKSETSAKGLAQLKDIYEILDSNGKKIAQVAQTWESSAFSPKFLGTDSKSTNECTEAFNKLTTDELRGYDPHTITLESSPSDISKKICYALRYNYFDAVEDDENYGKINLDDLYYETKRLCYMKTIEGKTKPLYYEQRNTDGGKHSFSLTDPITGSTFFSVDIYADDDERVSSPHITLTSKGDGRVGGSTNTDDYKRQVSSHLFQSCPISVRAYNGATNVLDSTIFSTKVEDMNDENYGRYTKDYSGNVTITEGEDSTELAVSEIGENCDFMSVSSEKVEIDADGETLTVPASVTYYAHFEKDADGNYPTLDKYAKITCYPVYTTYSPESGSEISRVVYKVTEKSIEDYLSALKADFSTLSKE